MEKTSINDQNGNQFILLINDESYDLKAQLFSPDDEVIWEDNYHKYYLYTAATSLLEWKFKTFKSAEKIANDYGNKKLQSKMTVEISPKEVIVNGKREFDLNSFKINIDALIDYLKIYYPCVEKSQWTSSNSFKFIVEVTYYRHDSKHNKKSIANKIWKFNNHNYCELTIDNHPVLYHQYSNLMNKYGDF